MSFKCSLHKHKCTGCYNFTQLTLPVTITSKRIAYALWSVRNSVPFSVLKYLANLYSKRRKTLAKVWEEIGYRLSRHQEEIGTTWSCSLWRRHSWQMVRQVAWKSTWVHNSQCSGPGYTSTQCLFLFLHPEREEWGKDGPWGSALVKCGEYKGKLSFLFAQLVACNRNRSVV